MKNKSNVLAFASHALLWAYLLSPIVLVPLLVREQYPLDDLYAFNVLLSVLWCALLISLFRRPAVFHLIALPLYITTSIDLFLMFNFQARLSSSYIGVMLNDISETAEFIPAYFREILPFVVLLVVAYPLLVASIWKLRTPKSTTATVIFSSLIIAAYAVAAARTVTNGGELLQSANAVLSKETSAPVGAIAQTYSAIKQSMDSSDVVRARKESTLHATRQKTNATEVYVWVIGESSRPQNWSLYGYARDTTPLMSQRSNVLVFKDVVTTAPLTAIAVPSMLSLKPISQWDAVIREKSIIGGFRELGFKTIWLSTQEADGWAGLIPQIANEAEETRFFDHAHDGVLLESLQQALAGMSEGEKLFVVIHTKGSHFEYNRRYPSEFAKFGGNKPTLIDEYDNSVRYTDWFISNVIGLLESKGYLSALLYTSDHGENLRDDKRNLLGHSIGTEYDLRVAAFMWFSEGFLNQNRSRICTGRKNQALPLSLSDLPHSFLDIIGVASPQLDQSRSIFDPSFAVHPRAYMLNGALYAYADEATVGERRGDLPRCEQ